MFLKVILELIFWDNRTITGCAKMTQILRKFIPVLIAGLFYRSDLKRRIPGEGTILQKYLILHVDDLLNVIQFLV